MKRSYHRYSPLGNAVKVLPALCSALLLSGCAATGMESDDEPDEGIPAEIALSLSSRPCSPALRSSRADDGVPADPTVDNEKIKDWFIVFIDRNGVVRKILNRSDAETKINASTAAAVELETFRCILPTGTYTLFAFANITPAELSAATGKSFTVGKQLSTDDLDAIKKAEWTTELNNWDIAKPIPMSGWLPNVKVENTIEEAFSIEVVRMVAKIEFILSNPTSKEITLHEISLDPVTSTPISLFPNGVAGISYDFLGNNAYTPLSNAEYAPLSFSLPSGGVSIASGNTGNLPFYIKESLSDRDNDGSFTVTLKVSHGQDAPQIEQHTITRDIREYINRNDWIEIPVTLSQYDVKVEALFYPPIGGYPAYLSTTDPSGAQVFTFGTQGEFSILPVVTDKLTGTHLSPARYRLSLVKDSDGNTELTGNASIFSKKPTVTPGTSAVPDEINGTLSAQEGKCMLTLKTEIYDLPYTATGAKVTNTYLRPVYIIRDNNIKNN